VFLAVDSGPRRKVTAERLLEYGVLFIACGNGSMNGRVPGWNRA